MNDTTENIKSPAMRSFLPEEVILREGECRDEMYKILSGSVIVYIRYGEPDEHVVGIYSKSRCFGEWNMLTGQPSAYTFVAYGQVLLMPISRASLEDFIRRYPQNAIDILQNMAQSMNLMRKNVDLLLDEVYGKEEQNRQRTEELRQRILRYSMSGLREWPISGYSSET